MTDLSILIGSRGRSTIGAPPVAVPSLIQSFVSSANPEGVGIDGNAFQFYLGNAVGAGNCLVLRCTYPHGAVAAITDNNGNTWSGTPAVTVDNGSGGYISSIFVLPNANAGVTRFTVTFGTNVIPFQFDMCEYTNIATVSPVNGTVATTGVAAPSLSCGSFTPGNNNANGGNLICAFFGLSSIAGDNPTNWAPGGSFSLLEADIAWTTGQGFPHAAMDYVQTTSAAINPGITATNDTANHYNCIAVALKAANAGTPQPAGIRLVRSHHFTSNLPPSSSNWVFQFPCQGNLLVLQTNEESVINISGITDSSGNTWHEVLGGNNYCGMWYAENATPSNSLVLTVAISGTPAAGSCTVRDVIGAAAASFDIAAGTPLTDCSGQTAISNSPSITPRTSNGLVFAGIAIGQGPGLSVTSPTGAVWDLVTYASEIDTDLMENADGKAHVYNSGTTQLNFNWTMTSQPSNSYEGIAAAFKAA